MMKTLLQHISYIRGISFLLISAISAQFASLDRLKSNIEWYFSAPRSFENEKLRALEFCNQTFDRLGLLVEQQELWSYTGERGQNLIAILPGKNFQMKNDQLVVVGAHYDTTAKSTGVADNGSGTAALLEVATVMAMLGHACPANYTVVFVAFDFNTEDMFGSAEFVHGWLIPYMERFQGTKFRGAIILDSILNYDPLPSVQKAPDDFEENFPKSDRHLRRNYHMGNFIQVIGRQVIDDELMKTFRDAIQFGRQNLSLGLWLMQLKLPPEHVEWSKKFFDYTLSDHRNFWAAGDKDNRFPAILVTDTGKYRGRMQYCHQSYCDGLDMLNADNLYYLTFIADSLIRTVAELTGSKCAEDLSICPYEFFSPCFICSILYKQLFGIDCHNGSSPATISSNVEVGNHVDRIENILLQNDAIPKPWKI